MSDDVSNANGLWRIRLFGPLEVLKPTGECVSLSGKKAGELLAYLALSPRQTHSREKLLTLMWGDSDVGNVRTRMRQEVATLRSLFPSQNGYPPLLRITPTECQVQPEVSIDSVRFLDLCSQAKQEADGEIRIRLLTEAHDLYRADLLTEYDGFWVEAERIRFSRMYEQTLQDLAEAHRHRQNHAGVEEALHSLLTHNPLIEEAHIALMRLYAEQGQPTRVLQQYQALERALSENTGFSPTEATRRIAETLRENAAQPVASPLLPPSVAAESPKQLGVEPALSEPVPISASAFSSVSAPPAPAFPSGRVRAGRLPLVWRLLSLCLLLLALSSGFWYWKRPHRTLSPAIAAPIPITRHQEKWTYFYPPAPGEMPNAEGQAIAVDETGIYVTGLIQTEKEDADILTLKLSKEGKLLWVRRYSSPEHDCDRAFSVCVDGTGNLYVAGETYVPSSARKPGGWYLTLLHYDKGGNHFWAQRSTLPTQNEGHVRVSSDGQQGCYIGGTALVQGKQAVLLLRYDSSGRVLWQKVLPQRAQSSFGQLVTNAEGMLYLCGTIRKEAGPGGVNEDWLVACLNPMGTVIWTQEEGWASHGSDTASHIALDRMGNVYVGGVFNTGDPPQAGQGMKLGVVKYSSDGKQLWRRLVEDSGPTVVFSGFSLNFTGNLVLGGTEQRLNGNQEIVLARYDSFGNRLQTWRYTPPAGYRNADLFTPILPWNEETRIVGRLTSGSADAFKDHSSVLYARYTPDGHLLQQSLFDRETYASNTVNDTNSLKGFYLTGQAGLPDGQHAFMVLSY